MSRRTLIPLVAAALLCAGTAAAAQSAAPAAVRANSISLGVGSSPRIGVWHRFSPTFQAGVEVFATRQSSEADDAQEYTSTSVGIAPSVKLYMEGAGGSVLPYLYGSASVAFGHAKSEASVPPGGADR